MVGDLVFNDELRVTEVRKGFILFCTKHGISFAHSAKNGVSIEILSHANQCDAETFELTNQVRGDGRFTNEENGENLMARSLFNDFSVTFNNEIVIRETDVMRKLASYAKELLLLEIRKGKHMEKIRRSRYPYRKVRDIRTYGTFWDSE